MPAPTRAPIFLRTMFPTHLTLCSACSRTWHSTGRSFCFKLPNRSTQQSAVHKRPKVFKRPTWPTSQTWPTSPPGSSPARRKGFPPAIFFSCTSIVTSYGPRRKPAAPTCFGRGSRLDAHWSSDWIVRVALGGLAKLAHLVLAIPDQVKVPLRYHAAPPPSPLLGQRARLDAHRSMDWPERVAWEGKLESHHPALAIPDGWSPNLPAPKGDPGPQWQEGPTVPRDAGQTEGAPKVLPGLIYRSATEEERQRSDREWQEMLQRKPGDTVPRRHSLHDHQFRGCAQPPAAAASCPHASAA